MDQVINLDIQAITTYLSTLGIIAEKADSVEGIPQQQLVVPLGVDTNGQERAVVVVLQEPELEEGETEQPDDIRLIKFIGVMVVQVVPDANNDVARLVSFLNHMVEFPGFIYTETMHSVNFLYALPVMGTRLQGQQLVSIIGLIGSMIDLYQDTIQQIASGKVSFDQLLSQDHSEEEEE